MYICMCVYIYIYIHIHIPIYIYIYRLRKLPCADLRASFRSESGERGLIASQHRSPC